jgi:AraC family transcriptional regulator, regulatory protein of adaptative response / DNA-3-methyladenine glycosylase II
MSDALLLDLRALDRARVSRDPRFDGKFFVAVTSTRIYCRPVCPVRSPKPSHIRYYATAAAAAEAGYRPCLRCRPEAAPGSPAWSGTSAVVGRALRLIDDGALDAGSVDALAARVGIGPRHLHRLFVEHVGAPPIAVAHTRRLHFAKRLIDESPLSMTDVAAAAGFNSVRRFNAVFQSVYRRSPRELRRLGRGGRGTDDRGAVVLELAFRPPYDWNQVRAFLAARAIPGVEHVDERTYSRTVALGEGDAIVTVHAPAGRNALELRVQGASPKALIQLVSTARRAFDLAADPAAIAHAFESDRLLGSRVKRRPGLRIPGAWDPFECAVRAVLGQQVSVAAARTLAARLVARAGRNLTTGSPYLTRAFPSPAALARADLGGIGLMPTRAAAVRRLAEAVADGSVEFDGPVEDVTARLAALPGLGLWTAQYVALRALGDPDAFPSADLVLRRAAAAGGAPLAARALERRADCWRPWRGYAALHLWCASQPLRRIE